MPGSPGRSRAPAPTIAWSIPTGLLLLFLLAVGANATSSSTSGTPSTSCTPGLTLSVDPTSGPPPLPVSFRLGVTSPTPVGVNWSFGDGEFWNGSGSAVYDFVHLFDRPGTFHVVAALPGETPPGHCETDVTVLAPPLQARLYATPTAGLAPLTVQFSANITGGTGTIVTANWSFGDGDVGSGLAVAYTFARAGSFACNFTAVDSAGSMANDSILVNVSADAPAGRSTQPPGTPASRSIGWPYYFAGALAVVAIGFFAFRWRDRGLGPTRNAAASTGAVARGQEPKITTAATVPAGPDALSHEAAPSGPQEPGSSPNPTGGFGASAPSIRLSNRLLVHLAAQGRLPPGQTATLAFTQAGMAQALGATQSTLSKVLGRLVRSGVLTAELGHVVGQPRRLRIYRLTPLGETIARGVALRRRPASGQPDPLPR